MKKIKLPFFKRSNKGQSFMEMAFVLSFLLILVMGMIEFGNLMNQYINLVDGVREGARFGSNNDPFSYEDASGNLITNYGVVQSTFYADIFTIIQGLSTAENAGSIAPILLDPAEDQILVTFFSTVSGDVHETYGPYAKYNNGKHLTSNLDPGFIETSLNGSAPNTGVLIVEIFYAYHQLLGMPIFTAIIPDPIQVHAYAIMPLSAAEPTPIP